MSTGQAAPCSCSSAALHADRLAEHALRGLATGLADVVGDAPRKAARLIGVDAQLAECRIETRGILDACRLNAGVLCRVKILVSIRQHLAQTLEVVACEVALGH